MSRFYSSHEIKKFDKQLKEDQLFNASNFRDQLKEAINIENKRTNVDSAKKKAVIQGMDYNGFHQMVLGADLKGVKPSELLELKPTNPIMNNLMTQKRFGNGKDVLTGNFVISENDNNENNEIVFQKEKNYSTDYHNFRKIFISSSNTIEKILYLLKINNFEEIVNYEKLDSDIFLELIYHIGIYILSDNHNLEKANVIHLIKCLNLLFTNKSFSNLKKFIGKKHKTIYIQLNEIKNIFEDEETLFIFESIVNKILS